MNNNKNIIKGISIAIICVSSISVLLGVISIVYTCLGFSAIEDTQLINDISNNLALGYGSTLDGTNINVGSSSVSVKDLLNVGLDFILWITIFILACSIYSLIAGIIGLKYKTKLTNIFCLYVAGSVVSLLSLNFINLVLFIVGAIFVHKLDLTPIETLVTVKEVKQDQLTN